jgi:hypothetical protein
MAELNMVYFVKTRLLTALRSRRGVSSDVLTRTQVSSLWKLSPKGTSGHTDLCQKIMSPLKKINSEVYFLRVIFSVLKKRVEKHHGTPVTGQIHSYLRESSPDACCSNCVKVKSLCFAICSLYIRMFIFAASLRKLSK